MKTIPLTHGRHAIVDDEDFEYLNRFKWHVTAGGYVARAIQKPNGKQATVYMHRVILGTPPGFHSDHANANKLDNQRTNLRICSASQNGGNRMQTIGHKFKGITWVKRDRKWRANIKHAGKMHYLGKHSTAEIAASAYNEAAIKLFGAFARLNAGV